MPAMLPSVCNVAGKSVIASWGFAVVVGVCCVVVELLEGKLGCSVLLSVWTVVVEVSFIIGLEVFCFYFCCLV